IFYPPSPRYVGDDPESSLFRNVPGSLVKVGVFVDEAPENIIEKAKQYELDAVQLHGNESPRVCRIIGAEGLEVIKAFGLETAADTGRFRMYAESVDYFLFDTKSIQKGGSGSKFDWSILNGYNVDKPFFLSGGIGPGDAGSVKMLGKRGLFAVDINSRFEIKPGLKDAEQVASFIEEIKNSSI
ncbi:MAG TPA: phosphoribosylanthranilate isomerase, partial [Bacteroidales bacterium]|nr:phosphoribosylanthranilate isomerase [Bacteroidales bacterium]